MNILQLRETLRNAEKAYAKAKTSLDNSNELILAKEALKVARFDYAVDYERYDWITVDDKNFACAEHAIRWGRYIASVEGVPYKDFVSRYDHRLDERFIFNFEE